MSVHWGIGGSWNSWVRSLNFGVGTLGGGGGGGGAGTFLPCKVLLRCSLVAGAHTPSVIHE